MKIIHSGSCTQVMMKDISTPVPADEFQAEMRTCLKKAALVNYTKVSKFVKIEGNLVILNQSMETSLLLPQVSRRLTTFYHTIV